MKKCVKCTLTKSISEFRLSLSKPHSWCKSCNNEYNKEYRKNNPQRKRSDQALYRKRHPGKVNASTAKRDAAKKQRTPLWLTKLHFDQIEVFYEASTALTKELGIDFEVDHIVPIQGKNVSGLHVPWNLQVITASDNASKRNRV